MVLNDAQRQQVSHWLDEGLKLAEVQTRLEQEFGLRLTYLEVKLLVSELELMPRDPEKPAGNNPSIPHPGDLARRSDPAGMASPARRAEPAAGQPADPGGVSVAVDQLARPGALVSGRVTFSDGQSASWYVDQMGRLGLATSQKGYRPSPADMQDFQMTLEQELARLGL